jgi:hypothetical protein
VHRPKWNRAFVGDLFAVAFSDCLTHQRSHAACRTQTTNRGTDQRPLDIHSQSTQSSLHGKLLHGNCLPYGR